MEGRTTECLKAKCLSLYVPMYVCMCMLLLGLLYLKGSQFKVNFYLQTFLHRYVYSFKLLL